MSDEELKSAVVNELGKIFDRDPGSLNDDVRLVEDLGVGSMERAVIAGSLSDLADDDISYRQVSKWKTVGDVVNGILG